MWVLLGIALIVAGFVLRFNPLLVILASAIATGLAAGLDPLTILAAFGKAFNDSRYVSVVWVVLPVIGLLEAHGLQERARGLIDRMRGATTGRFLLFYLVARQISAAMGLISVAGHAQTVRPLVAPIAEAAAEKQAGALDEEQRDEIKAWAAATDNVGLFFGEDIFVAFGAIVLMTTFLKEAGIEVEPIHVALWGIPTAICAFVIHAWRLGRLDRMLERELAQCRQSGLARDNEELELGVRCMAAGIYDDQKRLVAGLSISAPADRIDEGWVPRLRATAAEISGALGYRGADRAG